MDTNRGGDGEVILGDQKLFDLYLEIVDFLHAGGGPYPSQRGCRHVQR